MMLTRSHQCFRALALFLGLWLPFAQGLAVAATSAPALGASQLSPQEELQLGHEIMRQIRQQDGIVDDPLLTEYLNDIGHRLVAASGERGQHFRFFLVNDSSINAFALPGGYIGVNWGLWVQTRTESELAGVMAHEVAHVTQNHIARQYAASKGMGLTTLGALLAALLIGAATKGGNMTEGAIAAAAATSAQQQINFTRANEFEADRIGIGILAAAGYDPRGMVDFFKLMEQRFHYATANMPEFLSNHPLSSTRITEAAERAQRLATDEYRESRRYALMTARLRVLAGQDLHTSYEAFRSKTLADGEAARYGQALAAIRLARPAEAVTLFQQLTASSPDITAFRIGLAEAQFAAGQTDAALHTDAQALELFPQNGPLMLSYADLLLKGGQPEQARVLLASHLDMAQDYPQLFRLIAESYNDGGEPADSHFYMARYYQELDELHQAASQLRLALDQPKLDAIQKARYQATLDRLKEALREQERETGDQDRGSRLMLE